MNMKDQIEDSRTRNIDFFQAFFSQMRKDRK